MENIVYENSEACKKCGGFCCKKCGCDYAATDFENLKIDFLQKKLEEGYISIVSFCDFKKINGNLINIPFLYLRARNVNRPMVDLLSMKTSCASLINDRCRYSIEDRPKGGVNLLPIGDGKCYPYEEPLEIVKTWDSSQKVLARLVKRLTGKSVDEKLREDVYQLFCDVIGENFAGVSKIELNEIEKLIPMLAVAYPEEYVKANKLVSNNKLLVLNRVKD